MLDAEVFDCSLEKYLIHPRARGEQEVLLRRIRAATLRRALLVTLSLIRPKIDDVIKAVGLSNDGLLSTFLASNRKAKSTLSVSLNFFENDVSHWKYFGARKKLRP